MAKKTTRKNSGVKRGSRYSCSVCGLIVKVDNCCGCATPCDIVCCGRAMKPKKKA